MIKWFFENTPFEFQIFTKDTSTWYWPVAEYYEKCLFLGKDGFSDDVWDLDATEEVTNDIYNGWNKESVVDFLLGKE